MSIDHTRTQLPTTDELPYLPPLTDEDIAFILAAATKWPADIARMLIDPAWRKQ